MTFQELGLSKELLQAVSNSGYTTPTPVQANAIPAILNGDDVLAGAQTGTGKTAGFTLPMLHLLQAKSGKTKHIRALVLTPTRELAAQIDESVQTYGKFLPIRSTVVFGGVGINPQIAKLKRGVDILVATPGRLLDLIGQGKVNLSQIEFFVLDEADRMLDMGFLEDIKKIISHLPKEHQTILFSATMPKSIEQLARSICKQPEKIALSISKPAEGVDQKVYLTFDEQKDNVLAYLLKERNNYDSIIVFTSSKQKVSQIVRTLNKSGLAAKGISSNLTQDDREEVLRGFRSKRIRILVATDVMSRGIDIKEINLVVNYDVPGDAEDYVHRVGRTARAKTKGEAITLVNQKDMYKFRKIEQLIESSISKLNPPEEFGEAPKWQEGKPKHKKFKGKRKWKPKYTKKHTK